ncbi:uncharacterized protein LOC112180975 [Rosa chinensis]|uniref:uncharacterized protein LOC112180975 n=1 Tax=Rosa chinensis TaxID=74649 RepID=UPI000D0971FE|nr:uncharacterized protein LOC112180975 [Rosa chinensis]XP_024175333.1 uncharacterized protein LOC112180975 [Rosa chinensis]XP_040367845.1 uncharacterized protein LOC112180975 [Rosa chinensis]XP_040367846.1 uncharacterized protein LOC112180975 [Rosa chinensis]
MGPLHVFYNCICLNEMARQAGPTETASCHKETGRGVFWVFYERKRSSARLRKEEKGCERSSARDMHRKKKRGIHIVRLIGERKRRGGREEDEEEESGLPDIERKRSAPIRSSIGRRSFWVTLTLCSLGTLKRIEF